MGPRAQLPCAAALPPPLAAPGTTSSQARARTVWRKSVALEGIYTPDLITAVLERSWPGRGAAARAWACATYQGTGATMTRFHLSSSGPCIPGASGCMAASALAAHVAAQLGPWILPCFLASEASPINGLLHITDRSAGYPRCSSQGLCGAPGAHARVKAHRPGLIVLSRARTRC